MIVEQSRIIDPQRKVQVVTFVDPDGTTHKVQHPLAQPGYDALSVEAEVRAAMQRTYDAFHAALAALNEAQG